MSALGQQRTLWLGEGMSALPPKADIRPRNYHVRYGPKPDSCSATKISLFDHLVGGLLQTQRHVEAQRLGGLEVDDQLKLCRRLDREIGRLLALEDAVDVLWHLAKLFDKIS